MSNPARQPNCLRAQHLLAHLPTQQNPQTEQDSAIDTRPSPGKVLLRKLTFASPEHAQLKSKGMGEERSGKMGDHSKSRHGDPVASRLAERNCSESTCSSTAATSLDQRALCLTHFLLRCYAKLEALDPRGQKSREERVDLAAMRAFIEECSHKALEVSLHRENLTNLERARLLDILLWASELFLVLRAPRVTPEEPSFFAENHGSTRVASRRS